MMKNWLVMMELVNPYLKDEARKVASTVCRDWFDADSNTRESCKIDICYAASTRILRRCPNLQRLHLKGHKRGVMGSNHWGCEADLWVREITKADMFQALKSISLKRMILKDEDLDRIAKSRLDKLQVLKLDSCSGFSTDGLLSIAIHCRCVTWSFFK